MAPEPWRPIAADEDDSLALLFMCCHPSLTETSAIALTLRAVGGLSTREIAAAFLVPEATMGQRIARAKQTIRSSGIGFDPPVGSERAGRVAAVLRILYLIFNEGYAATSGPTLQRPELAVEAIRLARETHRLLPEDPEAVGLLALMLLTEARRSARETDGGELVPLDEQDRRQWDQELIREGLALIDRIVAHGTLGVYGMQAMIAAAHDRAPSTAETDWAEIEALHRLLARLDDNPMVHLNHAVALAMHRGPEVGLARLEELRDDTRLSGHFRYAAVRGHLCERAGCLPAALEAFREAHRRVAPGAERRFLERCLARVEASLEGSPADEGGPC